MTSKTTRKIQDYAKTLPLYSSFTSKKFCRHQTNSTEVYATDTIKKENVTCLHYA